nr:MAG TPA: minor capsid protein [Caudoviricetes sp.]
MEKLKRKLASETGKSLKELEKLLRQAADAAMKPYDGLMNAEPYLRNEIAEAMAVAQYVETARAMVNLSNTTVSSASYQGLVDRAVSAVQLGTESYQSAIRSVLRGAAWDGLCVIDNTRKVRYASGLTRRLDTAARQSVLDGFRALMQRTRDEAGKAFGADGVEISAHMLCAEDHLPYQGRQFSLEEFERLNQTLRRPIAKGIWNCSHVAEPIVLGISEPAYTEEELAEYRKSSVEQVTIDGKTQSRYQWTQEQRRIETAIRREKDVAIAAKAAGDDVLRRQCQQRINDLRKRYDRISKGAGLEVRTDKMAVSGFRAVKTVEQLSDAEKYKNAVFATENLYQRHVSKHLAEYGGISEEEYINRARKLLQSPASDDILSLKRSDGSVSKYRISTNEFVVGTKDGHIRTAFKPKDKMDYWGDEIERNR